MAGTGWKAAGTILLVLGGILTFAGIVGAAMGAAFAGDAARDADDRCGLFARPCHPDAGERAEAGVAVAAVGGVAVAGGALLLVAGIVLVFVGVAASRRPA